MIVKVCGVTDIDNALAVADAGADWIGLNFWRGSKRFVDRLRARAIGVALKRSYPQVVTVGLFVNHSAKEIEAAAQASGIDLIQLHGDESSVFARRFGERCIKALALKVDADLQRAAEYSECAHLLVDAVTEQRGGSGKVANWELAARLAGSRDKVLLAGGLGPGNVREAIEIVRPYGVDVASGVESSPGIKDISMVREFVAAAREV